MIKNCIIYRYSDDEFASVQKVDGNSFSGANLKRCFETVSGFAKRRIDGLMKLVRNEELSLIEETNSHYIVNYSCEFRTPKLTAAGSPPPFVPVSFRTWLRKNSPFVISFDAGRKLSDGAMALLSYTTTASPSSIEHVKLEKENFLGLKEWILPGSYGNTGEIKHISMRDVEGDKVKFKQIVLNAPQLQDSPLFNQFLNSASAVASLSFATPPLDSTSRSLSCRINYWGSLTIYSPDLLDSEIAELVRALEKII